MAAFLERRQTIRVAVHGMLTVESATPGPALRLIDVGAGGFSVHSRVALPLDMATSYRFATADGKWSAFFEARAVYCKLLPAEGNAPPEYAAGLNFVGVESPSTRRELATMMEHVTSSVPLS
jgi:hypothetical protein